MRKSASVTRPRRTGLFWQIDEDAIPDGITLDELIAETSAVVLYRGRRWVYLHIRGKVPRRFRMKCAKRLGSSWRDFRRGAPDWIEERVILSEVVRVIEGRRFHIRIPRDQVVETDQVVQERLPPFRYAGDPVSRLEA